MQKFFLIFIFYSISLIFTSQAFAQSDKCEFSLKDATFEVKEDFLSKLRLIFKKGENRFDF